MLVPPPPSRVNILFSRGRGQHRAEVVDVRRELGTDALRAQLGHRGDAGRRVARLVIEVDVVELRSAGGLDVLGGQIEPTAHRLAVERTRTRSGPARRRGRRSRPCRDVAASMPSIVATWLPMSPPPAPAVPAVSAAGVASRRSCPGGAGVAALFVVVAARRQEGRGAHAPTAPSSIDRRVTLPVGTFSARLGSRSWTHCSP